MAPNLGVVDLTGSDEEEFLGNAAPTRPKASDSSRKPRVNYRELNQGIAANGSSQRPRKAAVEQLNSSRVADASQKPKESETRPATNDTSKPTPRNPSSGPKDVKERRCQETSGGASGSGKVAKLKAQNPKETVILSDDTDDELAKPRNSKLPHGLNQHHAQGSSGARRSMGSPLDGGRANRPKRPREDDSSTENGVHAKKRRLKNDDREQTSFSASHSSSRDSDEKRADTLGADKNRSSLPKSKTSSPTNESGFVVDLISPPRVSRKPNSKGQDNRNRTAETDQTPKQAATSQPRKRVRDLLFTSDPTSPPSNSPDSRNTPKARTPKVSTPKPISESTHSGLLAVPEQNVSETESNEKAKHGLSPQAITGATFSDHVATARSKDTSSVQSPAHDKPKDGLAEARKLTYRPHNKEQSEKGTNKARRESPLLSDRMQSEETPKEHTNSSCAKADEKALFRGRSGLCIIHF